MDKTLGEETVLKNLRISTEEVREKSPGGFPTSTYKIPVILLLLFGAFSLRVLNPSFLSWGLIRKDSYHFQNDTLGGFFVGDLSFFVNNGQEQAENKIVQLFPPKLQSKVKKVIRPVLVLCEKHQIDPFWALSVMWTESHFKHESISVKGAKGLMQLMPDTFHETLTEMKVKGIILESERGEDYLRYQYQFSFSSLGHSQLTSKLRNLEVGIYYLKGLLGTFNNNHFYATVAYNMGPHWTKSQLKSNRPVGKKNRYLNKVLQNYNHITNTMGPHQHVTVITRI
jgi:hypothetical protein